MRAPIALVLAAALGSTPSFALPEGVLEVGGGSALGSALGGLAGGGAVFLLANSNISLTQGLGLDGAVPVLFIDYLALPVVGAVGGGALGAFTVSAFRDQPLSPAPAMAAGGSLILGSLCAAPGFIGAVQSFDQADQAANCNDSCAAAVAGIIFAGLSVASFCVGAPVGAGVGGAAGAALVAPEVPPQLPEPPVAPELPPVSPSPVAPAELPPPALNPPAPIEPPAAPASDGSSDDTGGADGTTGTDAEAPTQPPAEIETAPTEPPAPLDT